MDSIIQYMAEWSHSLRHEDIPERVVKKARLQLFSVLGAIHASSRHEIGKIVLAAAESWSGPGPCTLLPSGKKVDLMSAVFAHAALSIALDYDDYLLFGHTGHSAVAVSLAMAEREGRTLRDALTAQIIANEIEGRLGGSVVLGPHNGQAWSHIHLAGAAAAAAKLLDLSAERTAHAMAIALYQPTYVLYPGFMGPDSKAATAASPTVIGVQSALLAAQGATGPLDVIEHPQGYLARMSYLPQPHFLTGLGRAWVTDTLAYKIYPGCAYIDTTVDAALKIRANFQEETGHELLASEVREVLVEATVLTVEMDHLSKTGGKFDPLNPVSINFSIPGNVALALKNGRLSADDLSKSALKEHSAAIIELSNKVKLAHDWSLTFRFLEALDRTLNLRKILDELKLKDLAGLRRRMKEHYQSTMGLSLSDLRAAWRQAPEIRPRLWEGLKNRVAHTLSPGGSSGREGFDLGRCPLENFTMPFAARVTITTRDGRVLAHQQDIPLAGPGQPLDFTRDYVINKYVREAGHNLAANNIESLVESADDPAGKIAVDQLLALSSLSS